MANPWDVAPILDKGDASTDGIHMAVGMALSSWEILDEGQGQLFNVLAGTSSGAAFAAYGTVLSPSGRAEMVIAAAETALQMERALLKEVKSLINEIGKLAGRRNDIAHGIAREVSQVSYDPKIQQHVTLKFGCYLVPPNYHTRKKLKIDQIVWSDPYLKWRKYAYTAGQIRYYAVVFLDYRKYIDDVTERCRSAVSRNRIIPG